MQQMNWARTLLGGLAAGLVIKKGHPVVQVSIYNSAKGINKIIELP